MISGLSYIFFVIFVVGPAVLGLWQLKEWRENEVQVSGDKKLLLSGLFTPLVIFATIIAFYLMIMITTLG